jgi:hypothetical protein
MGETYKQIANRAFDWQGRRMLARTWVISPDPELMKHVPDHKRFEVVRNVTEQTVERWYSDNGWGQPEYSYVIHDKHRVADGEQMVHAHVISPATIRVDEAGELGRIDHFVGRAHIRDLHHTTAEAFEQELGRVLGKERAREIIVERNMRLERERNTRKTQRERMGKLAGLRDLTQLLKAEKDARTRQKQKQKRKRDARQVQAELRMYARYVNEERGERREADLRRMQVTRKDEHQEELDHERTRHRQRVEHIQKQGRRIPTFAEIREQEDRDRNILGAYYLALIDEGRSKEQNRPRSLEHERE